MAFPPLISFVINPHRMAYIKFDKTQLINLEYSLQKELIRSNRSGSFSCSTILGCHTRKYHGLLICPQSHLDGELHVLLSKVDETLIQRDAAFQLGVNKYSGSFSPKGHKYVRDFSADLIPVVTYRVGGVVLTRETMFVSGKEMVLIRYTLNEAQSPTVLRLHPFLAFRNIHSLSKRNLYVNTRYRKLPNGVGMGIYEGYSELHMQLSTKNGEYVHAPDWYNQLEYIHEQSRGYDFREDLYVPGFFEFPIKKGESVLFAASTREASPASFSRMFRQEMNKRIPRDNFMRSLCNAAEQFLVKQGKLVSVTAGFPWYGHSGRFTFISLPGLSLAVNQPGLAGKVIDYMLSQMKGPLFAESLEKKQADYGAADTPLWFFRCLQLCFPREKKSDLWKRYGKPIRAILDGYAAGEASGIHLHGNGLIHIDPSLPGLTWMNARVNRQTVTPRHGYVVEVNALWYNALMAGAELAISGGENQLAEAWKDLAQKVKASFLEVFWQPETGYLADFVSGGQPDLSIRPNMLLAAALPHSPLSDMQCKQIADTVVKQLLTPRGLRTLSPQNMMYRGRYAGDAHARDAAFHQGTAWPWMLGILADALIRLYGKSEKGFIRKLYEGFESCMSEAGIGTLSEIHDGDPPYAACGAISFAASVGEVIRMGHLCGAFKPPYTAPAISKEIK